MEYLPKNILLCIDENTKIIQRAENILIENNNLIKSVTEKERLVPEGILNVSDFSREDWNEIYKQRETIYLEENNSKTINRIEFNYRQINFFKSETEIIINDIKKWLQENKQVVILQKEGTTAKALLEALEKSEEASRQWNK